MVFLLILGVIVLMIVITVVVYGHNLSYHYVPMNRVYDGYSVIV
jgi:uncharacterized membrane protein